METYKKRVPHVSLLPLVLLSAADGQDGKFLFEQETFNGNGRTCQTCHSTATGTLSSVDAQKRFLINRHDPLFQHDATDDGKGHGLQRILTEATILVDIPLPPSVTIAENPGLEVLPCEEVSRPH
jgi:cytochrome c peroxidase